MFGSSWIIPIWASKMYLYLDMWSAVKCLYTVYIASEYIYYCTQPSSLQSLKILNKESKVF